MVKRLLCVALVFLLLVPAASAAVPDPFELALLAEIHKALLDAYALLRQINGYVEDFRDLQQLMYPREVLDQLKMLFRNVDSILDEIERMSCDWRFSPRVDGLRLGLLRKGPLCRDQYRNLVGAPVPGIDADLTELRQW